MIDPATALSIAQGVYGLEESIRNSHKQVPQYKLSPEWGAMKNSAVAAAKYGYTGAQALAFRQDLGRTNAMQYRLAESHFGNQIGGAANAGINAGNADVLDKWYGNDASLMSAKLREANRVWGQYAGQQQRVSDMNTAQNLDIYHREQQAAGNLLNTGISNYENQAFYNKLVAAGKTPTGTGAVSVSGVTPAAVNNAANFVNPEYDPNSAWDNNNAVADPTFAPQTFLPNGGRRPVF